ncbi:MAG: hypothetical protein LBC12_07735 [Nitrososphaerota archaeon]|nr:hypothetical protein [Nitrososphaerota archaeon]
MNCSQFCASNIMFLMAILKVAALQKEGQLNYINALTINYINALTIKNDINDYPGFIACCICCCPFFLFTFDISLRCVPQNHVIKTICI